jgi:hypothetical protein
MEGRNENENPGGAMLEMDTLLVYENEMQVEQSEVNKYWKETFT